MSRAKQGCSWFSQRSGNPTAGTTTCHGVPIRFQPTNPKRVGFKSHERYARYLQASTTGELFQLATSLDEAQLFALDLKHDVGKGFAHIYLPTLTRSPPSASRNQQQSRGNLRNSSIIRTQRSKPWPIQELPGVPAPDPYPETRDAARLLAQCGCEKVIVSFTFLRTADGFAAAATVEALRSPSHATSSSAPSLRYLMWKGARLLTRSTPSTESKDHITGLLHGLRLGLAAAADLEAQSVEVYTVGDGNVR